MYSRIIEHADRDQLGRFASDMLRMLSTDAELLPRAKSLLYHSVNGDHFCEDSLDEALEAMKNEDGTNGGHWTVEDTTKVAQQYAIPFDTFNKYDWNYVMNMMFSDYSTIIGNDVQKYAKIANKFIRDKDAPTGKAYRYYAAMQH